MFIVLYGINNIGKTTQAKLLLKKLTNKGIKAEYIKFPVYDIKPSGDILNNYLRLNNTYNLNPRENQIINTINKTQFESILIEKINSGITIIAEDYIGTSIAWGVSLDISQTFLEKINSHLKKEDIAILLNGDRFKKAIECKHKHEHDDILINKVKNNFEQLAKKNNWIIINANQSIEDIYKKIYKILVKFL